MSYLKSLLAAFVCIYLLYLVTILICSISGMNVDQLANEGFPALGNFIAGKWLGDLIAIGGMASALGLYSAVLLSVSRVPEVMAQDGLLPRKLTKMHKKYNTPYVSILACSIVISLLVFWAFEELLIIDITLYGAALLLEFISLIIFRKRMPNIERPFRINIGTKGLYFFFVTPVCIYLLAIWAALRHSEKTLVALLFAFAALITGEIIWQVIKRTTHKLIDTSI